MDKSGIYARDSLSSISLILSYIPKIPDCREYVTFDLIGGKREKKKSVMTSRTWPWMKSIRRGRERVRDRERPGPSENQAICQGNRPNIIFNRLARHLFRQGEHNCVFQRRRYNTFTQRGIIREISQKSTKCNTDGFSVAAIAGACALLWSIFP